MGLNVAMENIDACVLATLDDIEKVKSVYLKKSPTCPNGQCLCQAMVPYPRLHFFTLLGEDGKTCGRDVQDGSLLFTSVKCGSGAPTLPKEKLGGRQFIVGPEGPLHFVTVPGENRATLVIPCRILLDVFKMAIQAGCTEGDDFERKEALDNVRDLRSEYKQYWSWYWDEEDEEGEASEWDEGCEEEAPEPVGEPDGSLESAQKCLGALGMKAAKELKALCRPPLRVIPPLKAAAVLLNVDVSAANEWKDLQGMLADGNFIQKMLDLELDAINDEQWAKIRTLATDADFTYASQSRCSSLTGVVTALILALISRKEE